MSDGITLPGAGQECATREFKSKHYQVVIPDSVPDSRRVHDFHQFPDVAGGDGDMRDRTTPGGSTFLLRQIKASASGRIKVEVLAGPSGNPVQKFTFFNSTADPNIDESFDEAVEVVAGDIVRVIVSNLESVAMDIYSTVVGKDV